MDQLERRMAHLEQDMEAVKRDLKGDGNHPGLFERVRTIERSRLLMWTLIGNIAVTLGMGVLRLLFG